MTTGGLPKIFVFVITLLGINSSVIAQTRVSQVPSLRPEMVREVDFCEIVKQPQRFFDQTVRITTTWRQGDEFSYLNDDRCPAKPSYDIAVSFAAKKDEVTSTNLAKLSEREYGGRATITAVGILRNPGEYYGYFRYRFEVDRLEDVTHVIEVYQGTLDAGKTYRAVVRGDKEFGLLLVPPLHNEFHYAVRIEWFNLSGFPELKKLLGTSDERTIVFSVISDERKQMTERRWNRMIECKIIRIE